MRWTQRIVSSVPEIWKKKRFSYGYTSVSSWAPVIHIMLTEIAYAASVTCIQRGCISTSSSIGDIRRLNFFCQDKRTSSLCGTCLCLTLAGSNHLTKKLKWELGQKSPPADDFMGSLRNCTPHTCHWYTTRRNYVFREGMKWKIRARTIFHTLVPSKMANEQEGSVHILHSLRWRAWKEKERLSSNWF